MNNLNSQQNRGASVGMLYLKTMVVIVIVLILIETL